MDPNGFWIFIWTFFTMKTGKMVAMFAERRGETFLEGLSIASQLGINTLTYVISNSLSLLYSGRLPAINFLHSLVPNCSFESSRSHLCLDKKTI